MFGPALGVEWRKDSAQSHPDIALTLAPFSAQDFPADYALTEQTLQHLTPGFAEFLMTLPDQASEIALDPSSIYWGVKAHGLDGDVEPRFVGITGLRNVQYPAETDLRRPAIGRIAITDERLHGHGFGRVAFFGRHVAALILGVAAQEHSARRDNSASLKLADRLGYHVLDLAKQTNERQTTHLVHPRAWQRVMAGHPLESALRPRQNRPAEQGYNHHYRVGFL